MGQDDQVTHGGKVWWLSRKNDVEVSSIIDFSASINDFSPEFDFSSLINADTVGNYPDTDQKAYLGGLSEYIGLPKENILLGPGLTYFIYRIAEKYRNRGILILEPTFSEYRKAFQVNGCTVETVPAKNLEKCLASIRQGNYSMIVATRPDNPVGNAMDRNQLMELAEASRIGSATLFIDEAFIDFMGGSEIRESANMISRFSNVILGRSLTKILSIPSLRLGYIVSSEDFIRDLREHLEPWSVSQIALEFLSRVDFRGLQAVADDVREGREYLVERSEKLGMKLCGTPVANFVTLRLPEGMDPIELEKFCLSRNILIRTLGEHRDLGKNHIRVAVKRRERTNTLMEVITEFMETKGNPDSGGD